jgi:methylenetetrahydrofolate reductase (NADPH)
MFFVPGTTGYRLMASLSRFAEPRPHLFRTLSALELAMKRVLLDCRHCADCAAIETHFVCPEARCPKGQRMGPCGGCRINGNCEVFQDRKCIWEVAYWRAKNRGELDKLRYAMPPRNWKLYETSSWLNYYTGRDHAAAKVLPAEPLVQPEQTGVPGNTHLPG